MYYWYVRLSFYLNVISFKAKIGIGFAVCLIFYLRCYIIFRDDEMGIQCRFRAVTETFENRQVELVGQGMFSWYSETSIFLTLGYFA